MKGNSFGRRSVSRHVPQHGAAAIEPLDFEQASADAAALQRELSPEEELDAWKAERMRTRFSRVPWRQLYLMAGLCFGIGGFMLPDSINDAFSWVLYGLAFASVYAGIMRRKEAALAN